jgi:hypothetical protein
MSSLGILPATSSEDEEDTEASSATNTSHQNSIMTLVHRAYEKLHDPVPQELVSKMRIAMIDIPDSVRGLEDCRSHLTKKEYHTLLDMLVVQYVLNDGILLRQRHDSADEYHVDVGGGWDDDAQVAKHKRN